MIQHIINASFDLYLILYWAFGLKSFLAQIYLFEDSMILRARAEGLFEVKVDLVINYCYNRCINFKKNVIQLCEKGI